MSVPVLPKWFAEHTRGSRGPAPPRPIDAVSASGIDLRRAASQAQARFEPKPSTLFADEAFDQIGMRAQFRYEAAEEPLFGPSMGCQATRKAHVSLDLNQALPRRGRLCSRSIPQYGDLRCRGSN